MDAFVHALSTVHSIWGHYGLPESRAALEIVLQMRAEPEFLARALPYLAEIRGAIDRMWMGLFEELGERSRLDDVALSARLDLALQELLQ